MPDPKVYTVSKVNSYISGLIGEDYFLKRLSVTGEVSNLNKYDQSPSGHIYFQLKDNDSEIACRMWRSKRQTGLGFPLKDGDAVIVTGRVDVYSEKGTYNISADRIVLAGQGALAARFEELKNELGEMGMFDEAYKKPIPRFAKRVGIVTAGAGAAIRDIIRTARNKNPYVELVLAPARVQGEGAAEEIAEAIARLDCADCDVLIVGRGGGSIEDLWAFNEEIVARAIFACETPVISAVGHEKDVVISDLVADYRAATPTAAAELAVFDYDEYVSTLREYKRRLFLGIDNRIDRYRLRLESVFNKLRLQSPTARLSGYRQRLLTYEERLLRRSPEIIAADKKKQAEAMREKLLEAMERKLERLHHRSALMYERIEGASPAKKLSAGYSYVKGADNRKLTSSEGVSVGDEISIYLSRGRLDALVTKVS
ncbi:MAG: exodeoxyribonuclease VII large subunit [Lachnospiraceae bacterium]|nr:exodeoxyribonuclease VII large subunit [Lachnospiraceae bacterium]